MQTTSYERVLILADIVAAIRITRHPPLPRSAAVDAPIGAIPRWTEYAAMVLWREGWIPHGDIPNRQYWISYRDRRRISSPDDGKILRPRYADLERECPVCRESKPLDRDHWHRNPNGRGGWHSICKTCRNHDSRLRMAAKRAV